MFFCFEFHASTAASSTKNYDFTKVFLDASEGLVVLDVPRLGDLKNTEGPPVASSVVALLPSEISRAVKLVQADLVVAPSAARSGHSSVYLCKSAQSGDVLFRVEAEAGFATNFECLFVSNQNRKGERKHRST